jgi:hypothetical protein
VHELILAELSNPESLQSKTEEVAVQKLMTDDDEDVVLIEILFGLVVNLAVDSEDISMELIRPASIMSTPDPGVLGVKQVIVDVIAQLAR